MTIDAGQVRGWGRLAFDATLGLTAVVEGMHLNISRAPGILGAPATGGTRGITGLVYGSIRSVTRLVATGFDAALAQIGSRARDAAQEARRSPSEREALVSVLNGVVGDHLAATQNPLAIEMRVRHGGRALVLERRDLATAIPRARSRVVVLVHGLCMGPQRWSRLDHDHGEAIARDLGQTALYLHYNSGLHVSTNGRMLSALLERLVREWPVRLDELTLVGHSLGGLVARSACHQASAAGHRWRRKLRSLVFLGAPHLGAPLERGGNRVDFILGMSPYTASLAMLGRIRSAGITDLRHGSLLDEDWEARDRFGEDSAPAVVPLPDGVDCYAVAATTARDCRIADHLVGDGLVPVNSALGRHADPARTLAFPESHQFIGRGMNHFDLLSHPDVYGRIRTWLRRG